MDIKQKILLQRNNEGKIIPLEVEIPELGVLKLLPLTRGDILEIITKKGKQSEEDLDISICKKCIIEPQLTEEEFKFLKYDFVNMLVQKIFEISGLEKKKDKLEALQKAEEEIQKN